MREVIPIAVNMENLSSRSIFRVSMGQSSNISFNGTKGPKISRIQGKAGSGRGRLSQDSGRMQP